MLNVENSNHNPNLKRKEIFWLIGTFGILLVLPLILFGFGGLNTDSTLDINIHDTYFVIAHFHLIILISAFTFFVIYLLRTIRRNFKNITANIILMLATILIVLVFGKMINMLDFFAGTGVNEGYTSGVSPVERVMDLLSKVFLAIQIGLLILLAYCGFKTGLNYDSKKNTKHNNA